MRHHAALTRLAALVGLAAAPAAASLARTEAGTGRDLVFAGAAADGPVVTVK
jgi:hypothetical protein